jgi:hypothetical protein
MFEAVSSSDGRLNRADEIEDQDEWEDLKV